MNSQAKDAKSQCPLICPAPAPCGLLLCFTLGDDTLKIWDLRKFKECLNVAMNLTNYYSQ